MGKYFESNPTSRRLSDSAKRRKYEKENNTLQSRTNNWLKSTSDYFGVSSDNDEYTTDYFSKRATRATELRKAGQSLWKEIESSSEFDDKTKKKLKSYFDAADTDFGKYESHYGQNPFAVKHSGKSIEDINEISKILLSDSGRTGATELVGLRGVTTPDFANFKPTETAKELNTLFDIKSYKTITEGNLPLIPTEEDLKQHDIQRASAGYTGESPYYYKKQDKNDIGPLASFVKNDKVSLPGGMRAFDTKKSKSELDVDKSGKMNIKDATKLQKDNTYLPARYSLTQNPDFKEKSGKIDFTDEVWDKENQAMPDEAADDTTPGNILVESQLSYKGWDTKNKLAFIQDPRREKLFNLYVDQASGRADGQQEGEWYKSFDSNAILPDDFDYVAYALQYQDIPLTYINEQEAAIARYIYNTEGDKAFNDYIDALTPILNSRRTERIQVDANRLANETGFMGSLMLSAGSMLPQLVSGTGVLEDVYNVATGNDIDANSNAHLNAQYANAYRGAVSGELNRKYGEHASNAYGVGMSIADFAYATLVSKGIGSSMNMSAKGVERLALNLQSSSAATNTIIDAKNSGLRDEEAVTMGVVAYAAEYFTEKISWEALFNNGGKSLVRYIAENVATEGAEELISQGVNDFAEFMIRKGKNHYTDLYDHFIEEGMSETEAEKAMWSSAIKEYTTVAIGGMASGGVLGGVYGGINKIASSSSAKNLTATEEKVVNKLYEDALAEMQKDGTKLNKTQRDKLWDSIVEDMSKGQIKVDDIESILGGDTYKAYQDVVKNEEAILKEYEKLGKKYPTLEGQARYNELKAKVDEINKNSKRSQLKNQLSEEVFNIVQNDKTGRLAESYREVARRKQTFEADLSKYKGKQREAVKRAIDSGVLNNTYRSHELVNILSKIEADKGITFDYTNNEKLKESGFALKGKVVNAFVNGKAVTLNIQSAKSWQSAVGHEIAHVLEGTDAYSELQNALYAYAESKGELANRRSAITELYKGMNADIDAELTADLVGDYLFSDKEFVTHLTANRNLFQKIYDEIKYLYKVATGKEQKEIAKVKKEFDKAWKELNVKPTESGQKNNTADNSGVKYSFGVTQDDINNYVELAYKKENTDDYMKFAQPSERLLSDVGEELDVSEYTHAMRDNDIRHIRNSHGESTNEKYPVTKEDIKQIPWIVENYDKVFVKTNANGQYGIVYVKVTDSNVIYYVEAVTEEYHNEKLLVNKQMVKTGVDDIPNLRNLREAINKKESSSQYLADLRKIHEAYAQSVKENYSIMNIPNDNESVKHSISLETDAEYLSAVESGDIETAQKLVYEAAESAMKDSKIRDKSGKLQKVYHGSDSADFYEFDKNRRGQTDSSMYGRGYYFAFDSDYSSDFGENIREFYLDIKNPYYIDVNAPASKIANVLKSKGVKVDFDYSNMKSHYFAKNFGSQKFTDTLVDLGYDGVIVRTDEGNYFEAVAFHRNQMKLADAITYDDNGNVIPISERFDTDNKDIRHSLSNEADDIAPVGDFSTPLNELQYDDIAPIRSDIAPVKAAGNTNVGGKRTASKNDDIAPVVANNAITAPIRDDLAPVKDGVNSKVFISMEEFANNDAPLWNNVEYNDQATKSKIMRETHNAMIAEGVVIKISDDTLKKVAESFPDLRTMKKKDRTQLLKDSMNKLKNNLRTFFSKFKEHSFEFEVNGKVLEARLYNTGINEVLEKVTQEKSSMLYSTEKIFQNSRYMYSTIDYDGDPNVYRWNYFYTPVQIGEGTVGVRIAVRDLAKQGESQIYHWGIKKDTSLDGVRDDSNNRKSYGVSSDVSNNIIPKDNEGVKKNAITDAPIREDIATAVAKNTITDAPIKEDIAPVADTEAKGDGYSLTPREALRRELKTLKKLRKEAFDGFEQKIANKQAELDSKKNKNSKVANNLRMQIERLKRLRDSTDAKYSRRISKLVAMRDGNPTTRQEHHNNIMDNFKSEFSRKGYDFDEVLSKAKNLSTFSTVDNTPQRVIEKALGYKEGQILADLTVNKVAQNETKGIRWLNSFTDRKNGLLAQISKQYGIKPGSKESAAAQMYAEGFYVNKVNEIVKYGDAELAKDFPDIKVRDNIKGLAGDPRIRRIYDETLNAINESRTRNAYPEIQRLDNYFLHFRAMGDTFSRLGLPFNPNDIRAKDLPTDLNGVTADLKPGKPYFASEMHRTGKRTSFDLLGGLERYLTSAKNQIYHIDDIQNLRALRNYIADSYGQANGLEGLDALSEEEVQERIKQVYGSHLSTFAKFLNEEANVLAGKTALIDRGLEGIIGRRGITFLDTVNKQVGSNMVGFNVSSSLTNFLPVAQTFAKTNKRDFTKAFAQTVSNKIKSLYGKGDSFSEDSPVIIRRKGAERFYRTPYQKVGDAGYVLMSAVDNISTELIARTKYNELTRKGMDSQQAHFETDKWVSRLMGDRSLGQQPQLYNSKMLGIFTKFQLEVRNQLDSMFYDTIQETKVSNEHIENALARNAKTAAKVTSTFVQLAVVQHLFGIAFEAVAGYNPAFDIISVLLTAFGFDDDEESEDTVLDNVEQGFLELLEDMPYTSTFTGGRVPISSALPIKEVVTGKDEYGNDKPRWETALEAAPYYALPTGYGQIKKTKAGLEMFSDKHPIAGSYTDSGNLRFPVEDTPANRIQAGLFGQYANENAREYFDNDYAPLKAEQIPKYMAAGIPYMEYRKYTKEISEIEADKDESGKSINGSKKEKVIEYINNLDIDYGSKLVLIKSQYPAEDAYNEEIINYINNREDLSYEDRVAIFTELGFKVSEDTVYPD